MDVPPELEGVKAYLLNACKKGQPLRISGDRAAVIDLSDKEQISNFASAFRFAGKTGHYPYLSGAPRRRPLKGSTAPLRSIRANRLHKRR